MKVVLKAEGNTDEVGLELVDNKVCFDFILKNNAVININIDPKELAKALKAISEK